MVSTLTSDARDPGFNPCGRQGKTSVSEHALFNFLDDTKSVCRPSDQGVNWRPSVQGETSPVLVIESYIYLHDYL